MTDDIEPIQPERQPSPVLLEKISICVDEFRTCIVGHGMLSNAVNEAYAQGESEGIPKEVIASMIRNGILSAGFSDRTVRRYLPQDLKRSGGYGHGSTPRMANLAIQTKAKPTKQLAPDSISKVIRIQPQPSQAEQQQEPEATKYSSLQQSEQPEPEQPEPDKDILPDVDDSLLYSVPQDYKIDLLDQYDDHYLMKIIKYLHNEINNSVVPETGTSEQIEQLQEENRQLANQNKEQANQIQQFQEQVKELTKEVGIRKEINMNDQTEITRLRVLLRRAGIAVSTTAAEA